MGRKKVRFPVIHSKAKGGTKLVDRMINSLEDANHMGGQYTTSGETPIVLYPRPKSFQWRYSVPEGFEGLRYRSGALIGVVKPGKYVLGVNEHIKVLVSKAYTVFDVPVEQIPTKDTGLVTVDMVLVFRISSVEEFQAQLNCSVSSLQTLLTSSQTDAARSLMSQYNLSEVYDLSGDSSLDTEDPDSEDHVREMMEAMNQSMNRYGVEVVSLTIAQVRICDPNIRRDMMNTAIYPTREEKEQVALKFNLLGEEHKKEMAGLEEELAATLVRARDDADSQEINAQREVDLLREEVKRLQQQCREKQTAAVLEIKAETEKELIGLQGELEAYTMDEESKIDSQAANYDAEAEAYSRKAKSKGAYAFAEKRAQIVALDVEAEKLASDLLMQRREFELAQKKLSVLELLAGQQRLLVSASNGIIARGETGGVIPFLREKRIVSRLTDQSDDRRGGVVSAAVVNKGVALVAGTQK